MTCLLAVYDGNNNLLMRFEYADARMPFAMTKGSATYYLAYDQVGTLKAVADASGNAVKRIEYDTFGNIINDTAPAFAVPFGFAGGLYDKDTKLVRFGYRDYDPDTGRWTAKDPILFAGGDTDLYGYCLNDPINFVDPPGLTAMEWAVPTAAIVSQCDTIVPGPADVIAGAIIGIAWLCDNLPDDEDFDDNACSKGKKGKSFRGGEKKNRDDWGKYTKEKDFQRWWHRQGKEEWGGQDIEPGQLDDVYQYWLDLRKPKVK